MKWIAAALAVVALASLWAHSSGTAHAQEARDPLIDPPEGGNGSRFQVVGQFGWTPGETVMLGVGFAPADPFGFTGPFPFEREVTVLRDGTWSFPVVVNDDLLGRPPGDTPGYLVVRAASPSKTATNAYIYTVNGTRPAGAEQIADLGFGPGAASATAALTIAMFAAGTGALIVASGYGRRWVT